MANDERRGGDDRRRLAGDVNRLGYNPENNEASPLNPDPNSPPNYNAPSPDAFVVTSTTTTEEQQRNPILPGRRRENSEATPPSSVEPQPIENEDEHPPADSPPDARIVTSTTGTGAVTASTVSSTRNPPVDQLAEMSLHESGNLNLAGGVVADGQIGNVEPAPINLSCVGPRAAGQGSAIRQNPDASTSRQSPRLSPGASLSGEPPLLNPAISSSGKLHHLNPAPSTSRHPPHLNPVASPSGQPQHTNPDATSEQPPRLNPATSTFGSPLGKNPPTRTSGGSSAKNPTASTPDGSSAKKQSDFTSEKSLAKTPSASTPEGSSAKAPAVSTLGVSSGDSPAVSTFRVPSRITPVASTSKQSSHTTVDVQSGIASGVPKGKNLKRHSDPILQQERSSTTDTRRTRPTSLGITNSKDPNIRPEDQRPTTSPIKPPTKEMSPNSKRPAKPCAAEAGNGSNSDCILSPSKKPRITPEIPMETEPPQMPGNESEDDTMDDSNNSASHKKRNSSNDDE